MPTEDGHCDADAIAAIGFPPAVTLPPNLATSASDDVLAAHGYDADGGAPERLDARLPGGHVPAACAHLCSSFRCAARRPQGPIRKRRRAVSIERISTRSTPGGVRLAYRSGRCRMINTLMLVDAVEGRRERRGAPVPPAGGHGLSLGTAETAWQGVNGIDTVACRSGRETSGSRVDASSFPGYRRCHDRLSGTADDAIAE